MRKKYVDRGLIKWGAFDALVGYRPLLEAMKYRMGKKEKPAVSEDMLEEMNRILDFALCKNKEINVNYYSDGYMRSTFGNVIKTDKDKKKIFMSTGEIIDFDDITTIGTEK
ncbi:MAG TPA: YolD-like family protein [Bacillota bacterium]|nr:YolD-like family protein [Bacillota bacterium]HPJ86282.1 YolD-like family protein [Bacillota bacterium]HPQ61567.1 YolD-like family protein [Bacillota bacterium]HRX91863.1 YolD-like family protein [Candidatus Izemoplasmatales bacterium]